MSLLVHYVFHDCHFSFCTPSRLGSMMSISFFFMMSPSGSCFAVLGHFVPLLFFRPCSPPWFHHLSWSGLAHFRLGGSLLCAKENVGKVVVIDYQVRQTPLLHFARPHCQPLLILRSRVPAACSSSTRYTRATEA